MKKILLCLILASNAFAFVPDQCPSSIAINNEGLSSRYIRDTRGLWFFGKNNEVYNTNALWSFGILGIKAPDEMSARQIALNALTTLFPLKLKPTRIGKDHYICLYGNQEHLLSGAITPPLLNIQAITELLHG